MLRFIEAIQVVPIQVMKVIFLRSGKASKMPIAPGISKVLALCGKEGS